MLTAITRGLYLINQLHGVVFAIGFNVIDALLLPAEQRLDNDQTNHYILSAAKTVDLSAHTYDIVSL
ncbi:TPA: hypothetical protein KEY88_004132 [Serratia marcescens]|nr:hypothetical protein [Serratia marcescens]